jgi:hypothetical protein
LRWLSQSQRSQLLWRPKLRDAGDEMVLEAALKCRAHALVTFNVRDFGTARARGSEQNCCSRSRLS